MASTLPVQASVKSNASLVKLLAPPPFLLLFLLLFLSLLSLLHINDLLTHSLSRPPPLLHSLLFDKPLLLFDNQGPLSHLLHLQQHYLAFLLSPCPIFILANLIIFTLFLSVYFSSSASSSDFLPEKFDYGDSSLPAHALPSHDNFFLASPPHQHFALSQNPLEEYHVLSFDTNYESTYYREVQSYNKHSKNWEKVKEVGINPYTTSHIVNGVLAQKEVKEPEKFTMPEKVQSTPMVAPTPAYKVLNVDQIKVVEKGLQENMLEEKAGRSTKVAAYSSPGSQAVVINMELAPAIRRTRTLTETSMQASHPPLIPLASLPHPAKAAPLPPTKSNMLTQRPPTSPRVKKSLQSTGSFAKDGRYEASKLILDGEKQASKPSKPQKKPSSMVRSNSDQRLSQLDLSTEVTTTVLTSPSSFTNKPHMQRAQSLRSSHTSDTASNALTSSSNKAPMMRRAQSLRDKGTPCTPNSPSQGQVLRLPSLSASIDGLSNAEANKCFSDFIAHRFALMKKERE